MWITTFFLVEQFRSDQPISGQINADAVRTQLKDDPIANPVWIMWQSTTDSEDPYRLDWSVYNTWLQHTEVEI